VSGAGGDAQKGGLGDAEVSELAVLGFDSHEQTLQVHSRVFLVFSSSSADCDLQLLFFTCPCVVVRRGGTLGAFCSAGTAGESPNLRLSARGPASLRCVARCREHLQRVGRSLAALPVESAECDYQDGLGHTGTLP